jgi:hypothetical protein
MHDADSYARFVETVNQARMRSASFIPIRRFSEVLMSDRKTV